MIYGSLSTSKKFNSSAISDKARLLYFMMYPHSDDFGRMEAEPSSIKMTAVPGLDWSFKEIEACLSELSTGFLIEIYEVEGQKYLQIVAFDDHQIFERERVESYPPPLQHLKCSKTEFYSPKIREGKGSEGKVSEGKHIPAAPVFLETVIDQNFKNGKRERMLADLKAMPLLKTGNEDEEYTYTAVYILASVKDIRDRYPKFNIYKFAQQAIRENFNLQAIAGAIDAMLNVEKDPNDAVAYWKSLLLNTAVLQKTWEDKIWPEVKREALKL